MRKIFILIFILTTAVLIFYTDNRNPVSFDNFLSGYYILNSFDQTKAQNAVAAVYLNYRMYDTLFEALMLLVCVLAIKHFSKDGSDFYG